MAEVIEQDAVEVEENEGTSGFIGEFVDELPKISRASSTGVWTKRLEFLEQAPGQWAKVYSTGDKSPHPTVNLLRSGKAGGVDSEDYEFAGRTINGEGFVMARLLTDEQKAEAAREAAEVAEDTDSE